MSTWAFGLFSGREKKLRFYDKDGSETSEQTVDGSLDDLLDSLSEGPSLADRPLVEGDKETARLVIPREWYFEVDQGKRVALLEALLRTLVKLNLYSPTNDYRVRQTLGIQPSQTHKKSASREEAPIQLEELSPTPRTERINTYAGTGARGSRSVFRDEAILLPEYLPHQTPHREQQLRTLELYFQGVAQNASKVSQTVMVTGPVGSGKTTLVKKLLFESLPRKAALYGNLVKVLHVNCRIDRTLQAIMVKALKSLGQNYPTRGYSFEELLTALMEELRSNRAHLIIAFDEADSLVFSDPSSLYTITRLREMSPGSQVLSSILISKTTDYLKKVDLSTLSSLRWNEISLDNYSSEQLADIIASRSDAFNDGCLDDDAMQLAADIAGAYGDASYALDLMWRAGKMADDSGSPRVLPLHIKSAKASLPPQLRKEDLAYLTTHQKLLLMAISTLLKKGVSTYVTLGEVEKSYSALCESRNVAANRHTQVWSDVSELSRKGIIETQLSGKGMRGRTTMIGLSLVSEKELMGELENVMTPDIDR